MISTVSFEEWHLPLVNSKRENGDITLSARALANMDLDSNHVVTVCFNDKALAVIAGTFLYDYVLHVSAVVGEDVREYPLSFIREMKRIIKIYEDKAEVKRFQMDVQADWPEAVRFAEGLGFVREAVMKKYGHDLKDHYLYARYS